VKFPHQLAPQRLSLLLLVDIAIITIVFLLVTTAYNGFDQIGFLLDYHGVARIAIVVFSVLVGIHLADLYNHARVTSQLDLALQLLGVSGVTLVIQGLLSYTVNTLQNESYGLHLPRLMMITGMAVCYVALFVWRSFYGRVMWDRLSSERVLFIGSDEVVCEIAGLMATEPERGYQVAGYLSAGPPAACKHLGELLGLPEDVRSVAAALHVTRIIVGMLDRRSHLPMSELLGMSRDGVLIDDAAISYETVCGRVCSRDFRPSQFIFDTAMVSRPGSMAIQSIYTNVIALVSVLALLPVMILVGLVVRFSSRGPVLIGETRLGQHAIPFRLNRFRTWRQTTLLQGTERRVTLVGKCLQRFHLDRLPILFNVLRGEMALVGPSPDRPEFADRISRYVPYYPQRQLVKPGLTGWSQINLMAQRAPDALTTLEYDLYYTKHLSFSLDVHIIFTKLRQIIVGI
jgi:lipopolysaccharide/colanic/teichoic acid biosynthesis glycosyltransferase